MKRRSFAGAALACATVGPALAQTRDLLRIGLIPGDMAGQVFFARDEGMFAKGGFDAQLMPAQNGPAIAAAVIAGALDVGYSNPVSLTQAHARGLPFRILAAANLYNAKQPTAGELLVPRNSPIRTAKDLNGKSIAVGGLKIITDLAARAWLDKNGGDATSVRFIEVPLPEMPAALQAGRVDAAMFNQGIDPEMGKPDDPFRILGYTFDALSTNFADGTWFSSTTWISANPEKARRFVDVMRAAAEWGNAHPHDEAVVLAAALKENLDEVEGANRKAYGTVMLPSMVQPVIDACAKYGFIKAAFPASDLIAAL